MYGYPTSYKYGTGQGYPAGGGSPQIAAGASYDWNISSITANDGDPVSTWTDGVASLSVTGTGTTRPLYKTGITPAGSAVLRFDGTDDILASTGALDPVQHLFCVAAFRNANATAGQSLLSTAGGYFWYADAGPVFSQVAAWGSAYRDGVNTANIYPNGTFALYEFQLTATQNDILYFANDRGLATFGPWDIARFIAYPTILSGTDLTNTRTALSNLYL